MIDYILFGNKRRQFGSAPANFDKVRSLPSPAGRNGRNHRSVKGDSRPKSEYSLLARHQRAGLRKSRSVERISNGHFTRATELTSPDGQGMPRVPPRSRPARRNGMKVNSRSNSREDKLRNQTNDTKRASESSSGKTIGWFGNYLPFRKP